MPPGKDQAQLMRWEEIPYVWRSRAILYLVHEGCIDSYTWKRGPERPYIGSSDKNASQESLSAVDGSLEVT